MTTTQTRIDIRYPNGESKTYIINGYASFNILKEIFEFNSNNYKSEKPIQLSAIESININTVHITLP